MAEETGPTGAVGTRVLPLSAKYGIHLVKREYNGVEYDQVVYDDQGKRFLLDNLERILAGDQTLFTDRQGFSFTVSSPYTVGGAN